MRDIMVTCQMERSEERSSSLAPCSPLDYIGVQFDDDQRRHAFSSMK